MLLAKKEEFRKGLITGDSYHLYLPYDISFFKCLKRADNGKAKFLLPDGKTSPANLADEDMDLPFWAALDGWESDGLSSLYKGDEWCRNDFKIC